MGLGEKGKGEKGEARGKERVLNPSLSSICPIKQIPEQLCRFSPHQEHLDPPQERRNSQTRALNPFWLPLGFS